MAKNEPYVTTLVANIARVEHCGTTTSGNSTYLVVLTDGRAYRTEPDGQVGHKIRNYAPAFGGKSPAKLSIRHGRLINVTRPDGSEA